MDFLKFFMFLLLITNITAPYTSLGWSSCSTAAQAPQIKVDRLSMDPMVNNLIYYSFIYYNIKCIL